MVEEMTRPKRKRKYGKRDGLFNRNGWWWIDFYDAEGKRHRQKAAPDYDTAKKIYRERMTAITKGELLGIREEGIRVKDYVEKKYWPVIQDTLSLHERRRVRGILDNQILLKFGGIKLGKLRVEDLERWKAERLAKVSLGTVKKETMWLKHLLNRAVKWKYLRESPAKGIEPVQAPPGRVRYLTQDERRALLEKAHPDLRLFILAALQTGARRGELVELRWADIDMRAQTVTFQKTKNGDRRVVPMTDTLREMLNGLLRPLDPQAKVLPSLSLDAVTIAFRRLTNDLNLTNLRFHDLRHDVASSLTMAGVPQRSIMEILGHRDPRMTLRYQHLSPAHLRSAIQELDKNTKEAHVKAVL